MTCLHHSQPDPFTDGIYGRVRWTGTGKTAVDGGDYRFFSTEYEPQDLKVVNSVADSGSARASRAVSGASPETPRAPSPAKQVRPTRTIMNNHRGQKPITNRAVAPTGAADAASTAAREARALPAQNISAVADAPANSQPVKLTNKK